MIKFSVDFFVKKFKNSISYLTIMTILTSVEFVLFELANHFLIQNMPLNERLTYMTLTFIIVAFSFFITFYVNNQFIDTLRKELGILSLSGRNLVDMSIFILVQCGVIYLISIPFGLMIGMGILPLVHKFIQYNFSLSYNIFSYNMTGFYEVLAFLIAKVIYVIMIVAGFVYRNEIIDIITGNDKKKNNQMVESMSFSTSLKGMFATSAAGIATIGMDIKERQKLTQESYNMVAKKNQEIALKKQEKEHKSIKALIKAIICVVLYFGSLLYTLITKDHSISVFYINSFGLIGIINYSLRVIMGRLHDRYLLKKPQAFIVVNDLIAFLKDSITPIVLIVIGLPYLIAMVNTKIDDSLYQMFVCFGYIVLVIIFAGALYFKNALFIQKKIKDFKLLSVSGYQSNQLKSIIFKEVSYFYILATICPIILMFSQLIQSMKVGTLATNVGLLMIISYIVIFFISYLCTYFTYLKAYKKGGCL